MPLTVIVTIALLRQTCLLLATTNCGLEQEVCKSHRCLKHLSILRRQIKLKTKQKNKLCGGQSWVSLFMWLLVSCQTAMHIVNDLYRQCLKPYKRSEFSALSARCTGHLSAEKTHSLPSSPPHPSLHVPQRDMRLFLRILRHPGWLEVD